MKYKAVRLIETSPVVYVKEKRKKTTPPTPLDNETQNSFFEGIRAIEWNLLESLECHFQKPNGVKHGRVTWMVASKFSGNDEIFYSCCVACKENLLSAFAPFCNTGQEDEGQEGEVIKT